MDNKYEDGVTLTITTRPFDPKAHKIRKCREVICETMKTDHPAYKDMCGWRVCSIDGKPIYGTYGLIPKEEVVSLIFEKNGKKIPLDVSTMYNPNVNNANIKRYVDVMRWGEDTYRVRGYFSHGDGDDDTYIVLWLVEPDGSIRNHISDYGSLVTLTTEVQKDFGLPVTTGPDGEKQEPQR